jgi:hypothetical protein
MDPCPPDVPLPTFRQQGWVVVSGISLLFNRPFTGTGCALQRMRSRVAQKGPQQVVGAIGAALFPLTAGDLPEGRRHCLKTLQGKIIHAKVDVYPVEHRHFLDQDG